ncbi:hypothetical protein J8F10_26370 [Gemmata sp. G18]|uniref:Uncharacterized protein n=1 Tax=Gemmata palustris TaxID=2822762 RepID=A0ABS5BYH8_9BACT|nr:DUF6404 family protein [Gemmata palustris]MBP3958787.1 hypothetical protein [Gemmata palustris]
MTHHDKVNAAVAYLLRRGVAKNLAAPLHYRILWTFNVSVPPPLYQRFLPLALFTGLFCAIPTFLVCVVIETLSDAETETKLIARVISSASLLVPTCLAVTTFCSAYLRWYANVLDLTSWEEYDPNPDEEAW